MQRKEKRWCLTLATRWGALGPRSVELREMRLFRTLATERGLRFHQGKLSPFHSCSRSSSGKGKIRESGTWWGSLQSLGECGWPLWLHDGSVKSGVVKNDICPPDISLNLEIPVCRSGQSLMWCRDRVSGRGCSVLSLPHEAYLSRVTSGAWSSLLQNSPGQSPSGLFPLNTSVVSDAPRLAAGFVCPVFLKH